MTSPVFNHSMDLKDSENIMGHKSGKWDQGKGKTTRKALIQQFPPLLISERTETDAA